MRRNGEKQPEDHIRCPKCQSFYGFVKCRITLSDRRNLCLSCAVQEEKDRVKLNHEKDEKNKKAFVRPVQTTQTRLLQPMEEAGGTGTQNLRERET